MLYSTRVLSLLVLVASLFLLLPVVPLTAAFSIATTTTDATNHLVARIPSSWSSASSSALYSSNPPPQRKARRNLQKRRRKNKNENDQDTASSTSRTTTSSSSSSRTSSTTGYSSSSSSNNNNINESIIGEMVEIRPLISATAKEVGEDYWIDEEELRKAKERQVEEQLLRLRKRREPGQVTDEKLWGEVLSPYKDNWIGIFSVVIIVLATIVTQFPELLQSPMIAIPDL
jgi:hypothetical protein